MHEIDVLICRIMRVTILLRHAPMRRPTSMGYPIRKNLISPENTRGLLTQIRNLPDRFDEYEILIPPHDKSRRVIPTIFQLLQSMEELIGRVFVPDVSKDSAHSFGGLWCKIHDKSISSYADTDSYYLKDEIDLLEQPPPFSSHPLQVTQ